MSVRQPRRSLRKRPSPTAQPDLPATLPHARTWHDQMPIHDVRPPHAADPDIRSPRRQPCTIPSEKPSTLSLRQRCTERAGDGLLPLPGSPHDVCRTQSSGTVANWVGTLGDRDWHVSAAPPSAATGSSDHPTAPKGGTWVTKRRAGQSGDSAASERCPQLWGAVARGGERVALFSVGVSLVRSGRRTGDFR